MRGVWRIAGTLAAMAMLIVAFGVSPRDTVQAQTMTVTPMAATNKASDNTWVCAKASTGSCVAADAQFTISITDAAANTNAALIETITVSVRNVELGVLGTPALPDSNPKTVTLLETGVNTGIFTRVVKAVNKSTGLVSDKLTGTVDAGTTTTMTDNALDTTNARAADQAAFLGGTLIISTTVDAAAPQGEVQAITAYTAATGVLTTAAFTATIDINDTYTVLPLVDVAAFTGQTIRVTYTPAGTLGLSKEIKNEEVKPTVVASSPAVDYITKGATTVIFSADITDGDSGFPVSSTAMTDILANNTAGNKGRIQLFIGTSAVTLTSANYAAITGGYRLTASYDSDALLGLGAKIPWYIEAEDLAGNVGEISGGTTGITSAAGTTTTIVDASLAGMAAGSLVGRTVTIAVAGVDETKAVTGYATGTGTLTTAAFSAAIGAGTSYTINKTRIITVDNVLPALAGGSDVQTGQTWSTSATAGTRLRTGLNISRKSIRVTFADASGLDAASVTPGSFAVTSNTVSSVLVVDIAGENADPPVQRLPLDIFLTLGTELASDATPTVTITGGLIKDKAGNAMAGVAKKAVDTIGPKMTTTLNRTLSNKDVTATVVTDELLVANPNFAVKVMTSTTAGTLGAPPGADPSGAAQTQTGSLSYTHKVTAAGAVGAGVAGAKFNLYLTGNDTTAAGTQGKAGHATDGTNSAAIVFELDQWLNNGNPPKVQVADKVADAQTAAGGTLSTPSVEQVDPIIVTIDFNLGCTTAAACAADGEVKEYVRDSHKTVDLLSASLKITFADGTSETRTINLATEVSSPDKIRYTLPLLSPKVGTYQLTITARDEAGNIALMDPNAVTAQNLVYNWKVTAAVPVELALSPGWNLISLPFQPANPAINSVIPADHPIDLVMSYDNVEKVWLVSRRNATTGLFEGDVVVVTADTAYFARTSTFEVLKLLRPALATQAAAPPPPPTIMVSVGWNLVSVVSLAVPLPVAVAADSYFGTLGTDWLTAMGWNPLLRQWESVPRGSTLTLAFGDTNPCTGVALVAANVQVGTEPCQATQTGNFTNGGGVAGLFDNAADTVVMKKGVVIGKGYWLYSTKAGVIIP